MKIPEYLNKKAVLEWLNHEIKDDNWAQFSAERALRDVRNFVESGAFDADESEGTWKATAEVLVRENAQMNTEVQRLRASLEEVHEELKTLHFMINQDDDILHERKKKYLSIIDYVGQSVAGQALSTTIEPNRTMTDTEKKISEIREALEKATQGQWKWIDSGGLERKKLVGEWEIMNFGIGGVYDQVAGSEPDEEDAHLIANAPDWLRFLLSELERMEREYAEERAAHNAHVTELIEKEAKLNQASEENERLKIRDELLEQLHAQIKYYFGGDGGLAKLQDGVNKLLQERQKLIEGLRKLAKTNAENISEIREWKAKQNDTEVTDLDWYNYVARNILKEIGVTVE